MIRFRALSLFIITISLSINCVALSPKGRCFYRFLVSALKCDSITKTSYKKQVRADVRESCVQKAIVADLGSCMVKAQLDGEFYSCTRINPKTNEQKPIVATNKHAFTCYKTAKKEEKACQYSAIKLKGEKRRDTLIKCLKPTKERLVKCAKKYYGKIKRLSPPHERQVYTYPLWRLKRPFKKNDWVYFKDYSYRAKKDIWQLGMIERIIDNDAILYQHEGYLIKKPLDSLRPHSKRVYACYNAKTGPAWVKGTIKKYGINRVLVKTTSYKDKVHHMNALLPEDEELTLAIPTTKQKKAKAIQERIVKALITDESVPKKYMIYHDKNYPRLRVTFFVPYLPRPLNLTLTKMRNIFGQEFTICQVNTPFPPSWLPDFCRSPIVLHEYLP